MLRRFVVTCVMAGTAFLNQPNAQTRVACLGTSITHFGEYTRPLAQMLGTAYAVRSFGQDGTTILRGCVGWLPYSDTVEKVIDWKPAICVIELGVNDAPPWGQHDACSPYTYNSTQVSQAYNVLIDSLTHSISPAPRFFICLPTPNFTSAAVGAVLKDSVVPAVRSVAVARHIPIIDNYTPCADHPEYFGDGLHPNSTGGQVMANTIYQVITATTAAIPAPRLNSVYNLRRPGSQRVFDIRGRVVTAAASGPGRSRPRINASQPGLWLTVCSHVR
jgi:lysophospholipase L1-like esterase